MGRHDDLVQKLEVGSQHDVDCLSGRLGLVGEADAGEHELGSGRDVTQGVLTIGVGDDTIGRSLHEDGGSDYREFILRRSDRTGDGQVLRECYA